MNLIDLILKDETWGVFFLFILCVSLFNQIIFLFILYKRHKIKNKETKCDCHGCSMIDYYQPCHKQKPLDKPPGKE